MDISAHKVTPAQRMQMIEIGLSPNDLNDIKKFLNGRSNVSIKEKQERIKTLLGHTVNANLGHANDRITEYREGISIDSMEDDRQVTPQRNQRLDPNDIKRNIAQEMGDYGKFSGGGNVSGGLMNLRESNEIVDVRKQNGNNGTKAKQLGIEMATEYYNAFITSLQKPSTKANMEVFKSLRTMLEQEKQLQGTSNLQFFQEGIRQITGEMYIQIKG